MVEIDFSTPLSTEPEVDLGQRKEELIQTQRAIRNGSGNVYDEHGNPRRWTKLWGERACARLRRRDREYQDWTRSTAMLVLTASNRRDGSRVPFADHYDELCRSWDSVSAELSRVLSSVGRYRAITTTGAHKSGCLHFHVGLYLSEVLDEEAFRPVMDAHIDGCELAGHHAHSVYGGAVKMKEDGETERLSNELLQQIPGVDPGGRDHGLVDDQGHESDAEKRAVAATILDFVAENDDYDLPEKPVRFGL